MFNFTKVKTVGKNEVSTNEHILVQMNKKSLIELKFKICTFILNSTNKHNSVQMNKNTFHQTKIQNFTIFTLNLISTNEYILVKMNKKNVQSN